MLTQPPTTPYIHTYTCSLVCSPSSSAVAGAGLNLVLCYCALRDREKLKSGFKRLLSIDLPGEDDERYMVTDVSNVHPPTPANYKLTHAKWLAPGRPCSTVLTQGFPLQFQPAQTRSLPFVCTCTVQVHVH